MGGSPCGEAPAYGPLIRCISLQYCSLWQKLKKDNRAERRREAMILTEQPPLTEIEACFVGNEIHRVDHQEPLNI